MSIMMAQPSLLLNSYSFQDLGGCGMFMDTTWNCPRNATPQNIVGWILAAYNKSPNKHLHNVVLNFHGEPGEIYVGEAVPEVMYRGHYSPAKYNMIDPSNAGVVFSALKGKSIGTIWLHSCAVAKGLRGKFVCREIALAAGCNVVAAEEDQQEYWGPLAYLVLRRGTIDDYEGPVHIWTPDGNHRRFDPNGGHWNANRRN
jgi:hypothetical protein